MGETDCLKILDYFIRTDLVYNALQRKNCRNVEGVADGILDHDITGVVAAGIDKDHAFHRIGDRFVEKYFIKRIAQILKRKCVREQRLYT